MNDADWIALLGPQDHWNERILLAAFAVFGLPQSYLDVGSGTGAMVNVARKLGVEAFGVDQIRRPDSWLTVHDLRDPLDLGRQFDLVTCLEVAEHLPASNAAVLCDTVARHVRPGGCLIWSAASPGQAGNGHETTMPASYWRTLFWERQLNWKEERTIKLAHAWDLVRSPLYWLVANCQVFGRMAPQEIYPGEGI